MKSNSVKHLLLLLILCIGGIYLTKAQPISIEKNLCRAWKINFYNSNGTKMLPLPQQANDKMIFYPNHTVKAYESGYIQNGIWDYDKINNMITLIDGKTKSKAVMKVESITATECVFSYYNQTKQLIKLHLKATK